MHICIVTIALISRNIGAFEPTAMKGPCFSHTHTGGEGSGNHYQDKQSCKQS